MRKVIDHWIKEFFPKNGKMHVFPDDLKQRNEFKEMFSWDLVIIEFRKFI